MRALDVVPEGLLGHDTDFMAFLSDSGLYVYSAILGSGSFLFPMGSLLLPSLVPFSDARLSTAPIRDEGPTSYVAGSTKLVYPSYPVCTTKLHQDIQTGVQKVRPFGTTLQNSLNVPNTQEKPSLLIVSKAKGRHTRAIEASISLNFHKLGFVAEAITQIIGETGPHCISESSRIETQCVSGFWRIWSLFSSGVSAEPEMVLDCLDRDEWDVSASSVYVDGTNIPVLILGQKSVNGLKEPNDLREAMPFLVRRSMVLREMLPRDKIEVSNPIVKKFIFNDRPIPGFFLYRKSKSQQRGHGEPISHALEFIHGFIHKFTSIQVKPGKMDLKTAIKLRLKTFLDEGENVFSNSDVCCAFPMFSCLRVGTVIGCWPREHVEGLRTISVPEIADQNRPSGKPSITFFDGKLKNPSGLHSTVNGTHSRFDQRPHRVGAVFGTDDSGLSVSHPIPVSLFNCCDGEFIGPRKPLPVVDYSVNPGEKDQWSAPVKRLVMDLSNSVRADTLLAKGVIFGTVRNSEVQKMKMSIHALLGASSAKEKSLYKLDKDSLVEKLRSLAEPSGPVMDEIIRSLRML